MADVRIIRYNLTPVLDLVKLAEKLHLEPLEQKLADQLKNFWNDWLGNLHIATIETGHDGYAVVWLDEVVGGKVAECWKESPCLGYAVDALACELCMAGLRVLVPEVAEAGCAALPAPSACILPFLQELGVPFNPRSHALDCRYGVMTYYPYKGCCVVCFLQNQCTQTHYKKRMGADAGTQLKIK